jgi:hypothetical protein
MMSGLFLNLLYSLPGAVLLSLGLIGAQPARDPAARLAEAKTVKCDFTIYTVASWKDGVAQAEVKPAKLSFRFEEVDTDGGTARVVGPFGASDIVVRVSMDTLHFVQSFRDGPLYVTTIIGRPAGTGRWLAVHTRHEYTDVSLPGYTSRPEQYYGSCSLEP